MSQSEQIARSPIRDQAFPLLVAAALCSLLASFPSAAIRPAQPYKAEIFLAFIGIASGILLLMRRRRDVSDHDLRLNVVTIGLTGFALFGLASAIWADSFAGAVHHSLCWLLYLCVFLVFSRPFSAGLAFRLLISVTAIVGFFSIVDQLMIADFTYSEGTIRIRYGKFAEMLVTFLPLLWAAAIWTKKKHLRAAMLGLASINWLTVMLSLSRGAFIAGIIGMVLFISAMLIFGGNRKRRMTVAIALIWLVLTVGSQIAFMHSSHIPATADYISGKTDPDGANIAMRLFTWRLAMTIAKDHPVIGVGAGNFGIKVNDARAAFRAGSPEDPPTEIAEDYLIERTHNEYLQILAELGAVGLVIFCIPFLAFKLNFWSYLRSRHFRITPLAAGAFSGLAAFAISSLTSSFSFRAVQNGIVFFIVFGLIARRITLRGFTPIKLHGSAVPMLLIAVSAALAVFSATRAAAEYFVYRGERAAPAQYDEHFRRALLFDPGYAGAHYILAARKASEGDHEAAASNYADAVRLGIATSDTFVQLARAHEKSGNERPADAAFIEGLRIYPRSVYLRAAYSHHLARMGRGDEARNQMEVALRIDRAQARGWLALLRDGATAAFYAAENDTEIARPAELRPLSAVVQYVEPIPYW